MQKNEAAPSPLADTVRRLEAASPEFRLMELRQKLAVAEAELSSAYSAIRWLFDMYVPDGEIVRVHPYILQQAGCSDDVMGAVGKARPSALARVFRPLVLWWGTVSLSFMAGVTFTATSDVWYPRLYALVMSLV